MYQVTFDTVETSFDVGMKLFKQFVYRSLFKVYELFCWFCGTYPNLMIENCSGGGGRYDLGMMQYSTQIWASDNTEPIPRILIRQAVPLAILLRL